MNKEELIGKLQMVYAGDTNALNELIGYYDGLKQGIDELQQENQKLKERLQQQNRKLKQQLSNSHQIKNQQKEFIEWLEDYIDALKQQKETIEGLDIGEEHILMILEEVLEKYKGIIGGSNENNSI